MTDNKREPLNRYVFTGRVHPERATLVLPRMDFHWEGPSEWAQRGWFVIDYNQITAVIKSTLPESEVFTLRNMVKSHIEMATSVVGFIAGYAYEVEVLNYISGDLEQSKVFNIGIPVLEDRYSKEALSTLFPGLLQLCSGKYGPFLCRCLNDLGMAIRHASDTAFYCYRALESLKQHFASVQQIEGDKAQWMVMSAAIGGSIDEVQPIRSLAFPARHGVPEALSDEQRRDAFLTTWSIVERFVDYRFAEEGSPLRMSAMRHSDGDGRDPSSSATDAEQ